MKKIPVPAARLVVSLVGAVLLGSCAEAGAQGFTNGNFDVLTQPLQGYGTFPLNVGDTWLVGWNVSGCNQGVGVANWFYWLRPGYSGPQYVYFGYGCKGATLSQRFATSIGTAYTVTFALAASDAGSPSLAATALTDQGTILASNLCSATFNPNVFTDWVLSGFSFIAASTNTTLVFTSVNIDTNNYDLALAGVVVAQAEAPTVLNVPVTQTVGAGRPVTLTASAIGSPASVQWYQGTNAVTGATNAAHMRVPGLGPSGVDTTTSTTLTFTASDATAGPYSVMFSNIFGVATTPPANLAVTSNLLVNGSFEITETNIPSESNVLIMDGQTWLSGWTIGGADGTVSVVNGDFQGFTPLDGQQWILFDPENELPGGNLSQTFPTIPGKTYWITFDVASSSSSIPFAALTALATTSEGSIISSTTVFPTSPQWLACELIPNPRLTRAVPSDGDL